MYDKVHNAILSIVEQDQDLTDDEVSDTADAMTRAAIDAIAPAIWQKMGGNDE